MYSSVPKQQGLRSGQPDKNVGFRQFRPGIECYIAPIASKSCLELLIIIPRHLKHFLRVVGRFETKKTSGTLQNLPESIEIPSTGASGSQIVDLVISVDFPHTHKTFLLSYGPSSRREPVLALLENVFRALKNPKNILHSFSRAEKCQREGKS